MTFLGSDPRTPWKGAGFRGDGGCGPGDERRVPAATACARALRGKSCVSPHIEGIDREPVPPKRWLGWHGEDLARHTLLHSSSFRHHVAGKAAALADEACWESAAARLEAVTASAVSALAQSWPPELDDDSQNGQRGLRLRLAAFLGERGKHVRPLVAALRESFGRTP